MVVAYKSFLYNRFSPATPEIVQKHSHTGTSTIISGIGNRKRFRNFFAAPSKSATGTSNQFKAFPGCIFVVFGEPPK